MTTEEYVSYSPEETERLARSLAGKSEPGDILCLYGDLGAGKTTFAKGFAKGLGVKNIVNSPTFTLIHQHEVDKEQMQTFYHLDLYRLENIKSIQEIGIDDVFSDLHGVTLIEWAEKLGDLLPQKRTDIKIAYINDDTRKITITKV